MLELDVKGVFEIDTRSLAVFRVTLGIAVVIDVVLRSRNLHFFYTDSGVVSQEAVREISPDYAASLHQLSADPVFVGLMFIVSAVVGLQLALGYKTRLATLLALAFVVSLDYANPFVLSVADGLFRLMLFWSLFLPLGERWSVDALHSETSPRSSVASAGSALMLLQLVAMYVVNGFHKVLGGEWWLGEAAVLMIGRGEMTFLLGDHLRRFPELVQLGGMLWFYMLLLSPLLFVFRGRKRYLFAGLFASIHLGLALSLRVGALLWLALAGLLLFCQSEFWRDIGNAVDRLELELLELGFQRAEDVCLRFGGFLPYPVVQRERQRKLKPVLHSLALFTLGLSMLLVVANVLVVQVALTPAAVLTDAELDRGQAVENTLEESPWIQPVVAVADYVGLTQQEWRMFATAANMDKYYVYPAETSDGELVDVRNDRELSFERPYEELHRQHGTYRERFYRSFLTAARWTEGTDVLHESKTEYLCNSYERDGTPITHVNMYVVYEEIDFDSIDSPEDRPRATMELYRHGCDGRETRELVRPPMPELSPEDMLEEEG